MTEVQSSKAPEVAETVAVDIYDQTYHLRGTDPAYMQALAATVDAKMRAVAAHGGTVDSLRVAVLAALNIADELLQVRERYAELANSATRAERTVRSRAGSLSHVLDEAIEDAPDGGSFEERRVG